MVDSSNSTSSPAAVQWSGVDIHSRKIARAVARLIGPWWPGEILGVPGINCVGEVWECERLGTTQPQSRGDQNKNNSTSTLHASPSLALARLPPSEHARKIWLRNCARRCCRTRETENVRRVADSLCWSQLYDGIPWSWRSLLRLSSRSGIDRYLHRRASKCAVFTWQARTGCILIMLLIRYVRDTEGNMTVQRERDMHCPENVFSPKFSLVFVFFPLVVSS